jgi:hypothetical protein
MKIYERVVIDMESGRVLEEESFEYAGPIARCDGGGGGGPAGDNQGGMLGISAASSEATAGMAHGIGGIGKGSDFSGEPGFGAAPGPMGAGEGGGADVSLSDVALSAAKGMMTGFSALGPPGAIIGGLIGGAVSAGQQGAFSGLGSPSGSGGGPSGAPGGVSGPDGGPGIGDGPGTEPAVARSVLSPAPAAPTKKDEGAASVIPEAAGPAAETEEEAQRRLMRQRMGYWSTRKTAGQFGPLDVFTPSLFRAA